MNISKASISVVLPVYNGMAFLERSVLSVLEQQNANFELIICDDCSTDTSYEYLQGINDHRIKIYRHKINQGLFRTLNFLLQQSSANLIHLWSQDDVMLPGCLQETVSFHQRHPEITFSYSDRMSIDENENYTPGQVYNIPEILTPSVFAQESIFWGCLPGNISNTTITKNAIDKYGFFKESMTISGDFEMWARLAKDCNVGYINRKIVAIRIHKNQLSQRYNSILLSLQEDLPVYDELKKRVDLDFVRRANRAFRWKLYPTYFNECVYLIRKGEFKIANQTLKEINKVDNLLLLFFRWLIVRALRMMGLHIKFYDYFLLNRKQ